MWNQALGHLEWKMLEIKLLLIAFFNPDFDFVVAISNRELLGKLGELVKQDL